MGFFHKEHIPKEVPKEDMSKYIAKYQHDDILFEMINQIALKLDLDDELKRINAKYLKTERQHINGNMPEVDYDRFLRNGRKMY